MVEWWKDNLVGVCGVVLTAIGLIHKVSKDKKTAKRKPGKQKRKR